MAHHESPGPLNLVRSEASNVIYYLQLLAPQADAFYSGKGCPNTFDDEYRRRYERETSKELARIFQDCHINLENFIKTAAEYHGHPRPCQKEKEDRHVKLIGLVKRECPFAKKYEGPLLIETLDAFRMSRNAMWSDKPCKPGLTYEAWESPHWTPDREIKSILHKLGDDCRKLCQWLERAVSSFSSQRDLVCEAFRKREAIAGPSNPSQSLTPSSSNSDQYENFFTPPGSPEATPEATWSTTGEEQQAKTEALAGASNMPSLALAKPASALLLTLIRLPALPFLPFFPDFNLFLSPTVTRLLQAIFSKTASEQRSARGMQQSPSPTDLMQKIKEGLELQEGIWHERLKTMEKELIETQHGLQAERKSGVKSEQNLKMEKKKRENAQAELRQERSKTEALAGVLKMGMDIVANAEGADEPGKH